MEDSSIVTLYWERDPSAIEETDKKYGRYCRSIAQRILFNQEDSEECVNDTYLRTWESIPPQRPDLFSAFLAKITRNLALDRYRYQHAQKRTGEVDALFSEMDECIPDHARTEDAADAMLLTEVLNSFLKTLPEHKRIAFVQRYWYACSLEEIAKNQHTTVSQVKSMLFRVRKDLQERLAKEGIPV